MRTTAPTLLAAWLLLCPGNTAHAQRGRGDEAPPVKVGSDLADVTAFDEKGGEFPLRKKLKGKHAVSVFGCLT